MAETSASDQQSPLPTGTVTFLFTDIEGSTKLWEDSPDAMREAMLRHDEIIEGFIADNQGVIVRPRGEGDSRFGVFPQAKDAINSAVAIHIALANESWGTPRTIQIRLALHTGAADVRMGDYYGSVVNRCARIRGIGHGGQTLLSLATTELVRENLPPETKLKDMDKHRLKDLSKAEHIFQLTISGLQDEFPPLNSLNSIPNNLPAQLTHFVGREQERIELEKLIQETHLVTLTGPGGTGKTRLAIQVAADSIENFRHGVFFVPLAPISSKEFIVQSIAEALRFPLSTQEDPKDQLITYLRNKQMLLVMDNFEHIMESTSLVREILEKAPEVKVLATSRQKLNILGETIFNIAGLNFAEFNTVDKAMENSCVELFVQSAKQANPNFELSTDDLPALFRILNLVQGMPLGVLLAAAWVDMLSLDEIADEIGQNFDFLETEMEGIPERQRSIRAVFEYSWNLLGDTEKEFFMRLSVFKGGFSRQAAKDVAGASIKALGGLVNKSLLLSNPDTGRYLVQALLQEYAAEQLDENPQSADAARLKHSEYYANFMEERWQKKIINQAQKEGLEEIETDIENIRAAWRYAVLSNNLEDVHKFINSLWIFYEIRGWHQSGEVLFKEAVDTLENSDLLSEDYSQMVLAAEKAAHGWFLGLLGYPDQSIEIGKQSIETMIRLDYPKELMIPLNCFALGAYFLNRFEEGKSDMERVAEIAKENGDHWMETTARSWMLTSRFSDGETETIVEEAIKNLEDSKKTGNNWGNIWPGQLLAGISMREGRLSEAKEHFLSILDDAKEIEFRRGIQYLSNHLGDAEFLLGEYEEAENQYLTSIEISQDIGQTREMLGTLYDLAGVLGATNREAQAVELLAVVIQHEVSQQRSLFKEGVIRESAEKLRSDLEEKLQADEYAQAWASGIKQDLETTVTALINAAPEE